MLEKTSVKQLMQTLPQHGTVEWIGIRPGRRQALKAVATVAVFADGLEGDHYTGNSGNRSVTLIQAEHLPVIASLLHREKINPQDLRRNIVVSGINLLALKSSEFKIGSAILSMTGLCHPCSRMEEILGEGGYNAMRGHGGINARVVLAGEICLQDSVKLIEP